MQMPSRTLTVILNHNQSKRFALPPSKDMVNFKDTILREARNKFRTKRLSSVFLKGGTSLEDGETLPDSVTQVWVSKGEPYCGPPVDPSRPLEPAEVRIIAEKSFVDANAIKQLEFLGGLTGVHLVVGMPDLHPGNRFPIGCAIASEGVYPALIGSDVGCGIALYRLSPPSRSQPNRTKLAALLKGLDEPWTGSVADWLADYGIERSSPFDSKSLGTVGAGNHFAEICTIERVVDTTAAARLGVQEGGIYLLVHTGSRGLGASILAKQTTNESNPYILPDSPDLLEYMTEHDYAVRWAIANRDLVAHRIKQCIFPPSQNSDNDSESSLSRTDDLEKIIDVTHNSVTRHSLTLKDEARDLWVHRKGAAPADCGIAPCPGSRGDFTWLLQPTGDGQYNAHSLAHGAGRRYGRNALHTGSKLSRSSLTTTALGSDVVCTDMDLLIEERPEAYKDVGCVVDDMEGKGICKGIIVFRPVVTYKVREGGLGRT